MEDGRRIQVGVLALVLVTPALVSLTPMAQASHQDDVTRIAVLDSGIRATHEAFADGQVVAWHDFVDGETQPHDPHGHGTAVASMAAGSNVGPQTLSHAPGTELIVGRVLGPDGALWSDVNASIEWAIDEGADVITLSIYSYWPRPNLDVAFGYSKWEHMLFDAIEHAHDHGVFVTVLAGNGMFNRGHPTMSYLHPPASSPGALIVGGADSDGEPVAPHGSMEPEVTSQYYVTVAGNGCDTCYHFSEGTSFSTPLVAGMGAHLIDVARAHGFRWDRTISRSCSSTPPGTRRLHRPSRATGSSTTRPSTTPWTSSSGTRTATIPPISSTASTWRAPKRPSGAAGTPRTTVDPAPARTPIHIGRFIVRPPWSSATRSSRRTSRSSSP